MPLWVDLLAAGVGALQGAMYAALFKSHRLDWLGVAIIGMATGLGGGVLRDILLNTDLAALQNNWYLVVTTGAALLGMLLERLFSRLGHVITVLDALTIGLFGAIGATKALSLGLPEVPAVFVGVLSAVGGSIMRDVLLNIPVAIMNVGSLYAVAAFSGAAWVVILITFGVPMPVAASTGVAVTFGVRVLAVKFNWRLPEQRQLERMPRIPRPRLRRPGTRDR
ncbi:MAG: TRIC cation channel family protein [Microbacteriaceae bacterium]